MSIKGEMFNFRTCIKFTLQIKYDFYDGVLDHSHAKSIATMTLVQFYNVCYFYCFFVMICFDVTV